MNKKTFLLLSFLLSTSFVCAQTPVVRAVVGAVTETTAEKALAEQVVKSTAKRSFERGARLGGLSYVERNTQIGREIMAGSFVVGTPTYQTYHKVKDNTGFLGKNISAAVARKWAGTTKDLPTFPAYYKSFSHEFARHGKSLRPYETVLEAAYGQHILFEGAFVHTFDEALAFTQRPVSCTLTAEQAMAKAQAQASKMKNGFFVITVGGNDRRAKDVLLLDLHKDRFISLNRSRARMWEIEETHYGNLPQGIELRENESYYTVSKGDKIWAMLPASSEKGQEIAQAYHKGYYIYFEPKDIPEGFSLYTADGHYFLSNDYIVSFALQRGMPLFKTVAEVDEFAAAKKGN